MFEIAQGGQNNWANIYLNDNAQATVRNSTLRQSATFGIIIEDNALRKARSNTYENNEEGGLKPNGTVGTAD